MAVQRHALAAASCGLVVADARLPDLPLIYVNEAFSAISGYSAADVLGRSCRFLHGDDRDQAALGVLRAALAAGEPCHVVLRNYRKDGQLFWNDLRIMPVHAVDGELTHFVGAQTDITARLDAERILAHEQSRLDAALRELREAQLMLIQAGKMNALGQMVAGLAHEINNPIAFVYGNLHQLRADLRAALDAHDTLIGRPRPMGDADPAEAARQQVDAARSEFDELIDSSLEGINRVKQMVRSVGLFARPDEAAGRLATLQECAESALTLASGLPGERARVTVELEHLPAIRCYPAELSQVFLNLIMNADQAMVAGRAGWIHISGDDTGAALRITVADNGAGMTPEVLAQIFTPFFTTRPAGEGMGLGLPISRRIITGRHRGTMTVDSTMGEGTAFTITLPKDGLK